MKFGKLLFVCVIFLCMTWSVWRIIYNKDRKEFVTETTDEEINNSSTQRIQSFSLFGYSESGKKKWEVEGKTADIMDETVYLSDVNAKVYGEEVTADIKANEGVLEKKSNKVELRKDVTIVTDEGTKLTTQKLRWNAGEEVVDTDEHVLIERKDADVEGLGASARTKLNQAQINKDVKVTIKEPPTIITCDGPLEVDYNAMVAYFYNNVKLDDSKVQIYSDRVTAYLDPKRRTLSKAYSQGNVKIVRGENVTYAEELTYLPAEGKVILGGRPKVVIYSTEELLPESAK